MLLVDEFASSLASLVDVKMCKIGVARKNLLSFNKKISRVVSPCGMGEDNAPVEFFRVVLPR